MTLPVTAKYLAAHGRNGDTHLVHMTGDEVAGLDALTRQRYGHGLPTNPHTGLPEASLLGGFLPALLGIGGAMMGLPPMLTAGLVGGGSMLAGGSLMQGLTAGLGAFGGAGLAGPFMGADAALGAGASAASSAATPTIAGSMGSGAASGLSGVMDGAAPAMSGMDLAADAPSAFGQGVSGMDLAGNTPGALGSYAGDTASAGAGLGGGASPAAPTTGDFSRMDRMMPGGSGTGPGFNGISDLTTKDGLSRYNAAMNGKGLQYGAMAAAPMLMQQPKMPGMNPANNALLRPYHYDPRTQHYTALPTMPASQANSMSFAGGGDVQGGMDQGIGNPRYLRGPGDGVSDSIPAHIDGQQPAALASNEYVVPARVVSELGNGSSDAGAKRLDEMVKRVGQARRKSMGSRAAIAVDSKAYKALPA